MSDQEDAYFKQRELEQQKAREKAKKLEELRQKEASAVARKLKIDDNELALHLVDLGFDAERVAVVPLLPLVYVAWADGDVTGAERGRILELAEERGLSSESGAYAFLDDLLVNRPKEEFLDVCLAAIRRLFELMSDEAATKAKTDLVSLSMSIAEASGGFLGLFGEKVSEEEQQVIRDIVDELGLNDKTRTSNLLKALDK